MHRTSQHKFRFPQDEITMPSYGIGKMERADKKWAVELSNLNTEILLSLPFLEMERDSDSLASK